MDNKAHSDWMTSMDNKAQSDWMTSTDKAQSGLLSNQLEQNQQVIGRLNSCSKNIPHHAPLMAVWEHRVYEDTLVAVGST